MRRLKDEIAAAALGPLTRPAPATVAGRFRFGPEFGGFGGHFPDLPILPAIVEVLAAVTVAEAAAGRPLTLVGVRQGRFLIKVAPDQEIEVRCHERAGADPGSWDVKITFGQDVAATFVLSFAAAGEQA